MTPRAPIPRDKSAYYRTTVQMHWRVWSMVRNAVAWIQENTDDAIDLTEAFEQAVEGWVAQRAFGHGFVLGEFPKLGRKTYFGPDLLPKNRPE